MGWACGAPWPRKGRNTGGRPWIFTILIIVSAWDSFGPRRLAISPSNPPSIGQFSFRMTNHVSGNYWNSSGTARFPIAHGGTMIVRQLVALGGWGVLRGERWEIEIKLLLSIVLRDFFVEACCVSYFSLMKMGGFGGVALFVIWIDCLSGNMMLHLKHSRV